MPKEGTEVTRQTAVKVAADVSKLLNEREGRLSDKLPKWATFEGPHSYVRYTLVEETLKIVLEENPNQNQMWWEMLGSPGKVIRETIKPELCEKAQIGSCEDVLLTRMMFAAATDDQLRKILSAGGSRVGLAVSLATDSQICRVLRLATDEQIQEMLSIESNGLMNIIGAATERQIRRMLQVATDDQMRKMIGPGYQVHVQKIIGAAEDYHIRRMLDAAEHAKGTYPVIFDLLNRVTDEQVEKILHAENRADGDARIARILRNAPSERLALVCELLMEKEGMAEEKLLELAGQDKFRGMVAAILRKGLETDLEQHATTKLKKEYLRLQNVIENEPESALTKEKLEILEEGYSAARKEFERLKQWDEARTKQG